MFETVLASMGMGAAKIDLRLDQAMVTTGEAATGQIIVTGGSAEQKVEGLSVYFMLRSVQARNGSEFTKRIAVIDVTHEAFTIKPAETTIFPFRFDCPASIPASGMNTKYYFITNLEIKNAIDSHDHDYIEVAANTRITQFLAGFQQLGFKQDWEGLIRSEQGWSQLIQYRPTTYFYGVCDQVAVYFYDDTANDRIEAVVEVGEHRKDYSALIDMFHMDEKVRRFTITAADVSNPASIKTKLEQLIKHLLKK